MRLLERAIRGAAAGATAATVWSAAEFGAALSEWITTPAGSHQRSDATRPSIRVSV